MRRTYHIMFKQQEGDSYSRGENFESSDPMIAYVLYRDTHPNSVFVGMYDVEAVYSLHTNIGSKIDALGNAINALRMETNSKHMPDVSDNFNLDIDF